MILLIIFIYLKDGTYMETVVKELKVNLHVIFVNDDRRVVRELYSDCMLNREGIPSITIYDEMILDIFDKVWNDYFERGDNKFIDIPFYDVGIDRFMFKSSNISDLSLHAENDPEEIIIEILEVKDWDANVASYIHLEPGLWKNDDMIGKYRACDDAILHIVMDSKILDLVHNNDISFEDGAAMTLFSFCLSHLELDMDFNHRDSDDELYDEENDDNITSNKFKPIKIKRCRRRNCNHRKF